MYESHDRWNQIMISARRGIYDAQCTGPGALLDAYRETLVLTMAMHVMRAYPPRITEQGEITL